MTLQHSFSICVQSLIVKSKSTHIHFPVPISVSLFIITSYLIFLLLFLCFSMSIVKSFLPSQKKFRHETELPYLPSLDNGQGSLSFPMAAGNFLPTVSLVIWSFSGSISSHFFLHLDYQDPYFRGIQETEYGEGSLHIVIHKKLPAKMFIFQGLYGPAKHKHIGMNYIATSAEANWHLN